MTPPPPPGPPWDLPVAEAPLAFVDLEMTGLDAGRDRVVEVCIDRVVGGERRAFLCTLVDPGERVGGAAHVHGLDAAQLAGAPPFQDIARDALALLDGAILVAHAAVWDVRFLEAEFQRAGITLELGHWLDTLVLARRAFLYHSYSLDALCRELAIDRGQAHRAESDVRALRAVFDRCVALLAPVSARDLWEVRIGERRARQAIVDACEAAVKHGAPVVVTYRAARRAPEPLSMVLVEVRSDLDPPRVVGYQLPGRGRRQLRADRILSVLPPPAVAPPAEQPQKFPRRSRHIPSFSCTTRSEKEKSTHSPSMASCTTGCQLGTTKMSLGAHASDLSPIRVRPRPSVTQKTVASVERYGFDLKPGGSSWMNVAMVGMA